MPLGKIQLQIVAKLVQLGRLTHEQMSALAARPDDLSGDVLDKLLQQEFKLTAWQCFVAKARAFNLSPVNVTRCSLSPQTFERLPREYCQRNSILPVGQIGPLLLVAFANPFAVGLLGEIESMTGKTVIRLFARERDLLDKFAKVTDQPSGLSEVVIKIGAAYEDPVLEFDPRKGDVSEESGPIIQLANRIIEEAYLSGTSDIHVEPQEKELIVRNRIDGVCHEQLRLPKKVGPALVARLKIMCNLDISERRLPQDGRIIFKQFTKKNLDIDLRVSTAPLNHGEGVVMRILDKQKTTLPLAALGFSEENLAKYRACIQQPYGMILHCGPTGSGKSMTLYSALNEINTPDIVIRTAEDPIEYTLPGLNQMQMHRQIGLTFATALRSFLRQDPDIILVGEIRDRETAGIAVEAALTGHLLISTLHTNDAPTTVSRLMEMGVERFMVSSSLLAVCAQRLVRRVCKHCRVAYTPEGRERQLIERALGWHGSIFRINPAGCPKCGGSGYKGRVGIHELMVSSPELVETINQEADTAVLKKIARQGGMRTLHEDSLLKVKEGLTTLAEALAQVPPDL
ncbi:MAG: Type secretion system protein [Verrucomicrobiota bacterium]